MNTLLQIASIGVLSFMTGFLLSRRGTPYGKFSTLTHKLISLVMIILLGISIVNYSKLAPLTVINYVAIAIVGILLTIALVTGAMLTKEDGAPVGSIVIHRITGILGIVGSIAFLSFLFDIL